MEKQTKKTYLLFFSAIISSVFHNLIYAIFSIEEAVFFILSLVLFLLFFVSVVLNIITYLQKKEPKDIWKLGFLGLFSSMGLFFNTKGVYGFFGFFGFFGFKTRSK